jgi:hypothetical protein
MKQGIYKHHKGGFYSVLCVARDSTNNSMAHGRKVVVYMSLTTGEICTREIGEFCELVETSTGPQPRFKFSHEAMSMDEANKFLREEKP